VTSSPSKLQCRAGRCTFHFKNSDRTCNIVVCVHTNTGRPFEVNAAYSVAKECYDGGGLGRAQLHRRRAGGEGFTDCYNLFFLQLSPSARQQHLQ